jgi:hypothetical protein
VYSSFTAAAGYMVYTIEQLKTLEKNLVSDLNAVRRVMALDANPDLIRVSELLGEAKPSSAERNLFETPVRTSPQKGHVRNLEIAAIILKFATPFKFVDVVNAIKKEFPDRELKKFSVPAMLRRLREGGKIREVSPRDGRNGATYEKSK